jgi:hypothetical protein
LFPILILKNILGTKLNNNNPKTKIIYLQGLKKLYITLFKIKKVIYLIKLKINCLKEKWEDKKLNKNTLIKVIVQKYCHTKVCNLNENGVIE